MRNAVGGAYARGGKRVFDTIAAIAGMVLVWPVILACAIAVALETPGGAFLRQRRVGQHGTPFLCLKLRTMQSDTPHVPTHEAPAFAVTRVGAFLRRTRLDELPQLLNVIAGEMALVGPRPCLPSQERLIARRAALGVLALRPGITGLAQVQGVDMSDPDRLAEIDASYAERVGFATDCEILLRTVKVGFVR